MSGIYNGLKQELLNQKALKSGAILQTMLTPVVWNWPESTTGSTAEAVYNFCDRIPSDFLSETFTQSSNSFSRNFSSFLNLINASKFPLSTDLANQININNPPATPAGGTPPPYWTEVYATSTANYLERAYTLSSTPRQWMIDIAGSTLSPSLNILSDSGTVVSKKGKAPLTSSTSGVQFGFKAKAWGNIFINVEDWYSGAIATMAQQNKGPYVKGVKWKNVFDPNGILPGRIASFIVALNPTAYIQIDSSKSSSIVDMEDIQALQVGGFDFGDESEVNKTVMSTFTSEVISSTINQFTAVPLYQSDTAYIIAVQLEKLY